MGVTFSARVRPGGLCARIGAVAILASWPAWPRTADGEIPDALHVIAAACRENQARIQSLQLSGTVVRTGRWFERQWDPITNERYKSQTRTLSVWKDSVNCRFDVSADRVTTESGEVNYNVPYADHIMSHEKMEREGGWTEFLRRYGTPQTTTRQIVTADRTWLYQVELNQLEIDGDMVVMMQRGDEDLAFACNGVTYGLTTSEVIDRWVELAQRGDPGRSLAVTGLGSSLYQIHLTISGQNGATETFETIVDLDKGANPVSRVKRRDGRITEAAEFEYMKVGSAWLVRDAKYTEFALDGAVDKCAVYHVAPDSVRVNEQIDTQVFQFEGLGVRKGARVVDAKTREEYLYDDMPLHLKAALAAAKEREEVLAEAAARAAEYPVPAPAPSPAPRPQPGQPESPRPVAPATPGTADTAAASRDDAPSPLQGRLPIPHGAAAMETTPTEEILEPKRPQTRPEPAEAPEATQPAPTRPTATRPVKDVQVRQPEQTPSTTEPARQPLVPSATATAVAVGAGCVAAIGIGVWKWRSGARTPRRP